MENTLFGVREIVQVLRDVLNNRSCPTVTGPTEITSPVYQDARVPETRNRTGHGRRTRGGETGLWMKGGPDVQRRSPSGG